MFTKAERLISLRNLRPKKKDGFLKVISIFSFIGITLGVAILIIVMSVMNGFKNELTKKILGFNPHVVIQPNSFKIDNNYIEIIKKKFKIDKISKTYSGEGIVLNNNNAKGIIIKGVNTDNLRNLDFLKNNIVQGNIDNFKKNSALIGAELAYSLNLNVGDKINLISSVFVTTPFGGFPNQETIKIKGIYNTGFNEFDQNFVFISINDALSLFEKEKHEQNLEIYLSNPMDANLLKKNYNQ